MSESAIHTPDWMNDWPLDDVDRFHIQFCREYARRWRHGIPAHHDMMVIAKLAWLLDSAQTGMYPESESWQS